MEAQVFPEVFYHMQHPDENVAKAAATLTKEVCKHTLEVSIFILEFNRFTHRNCRKDRRLYYTGAIN